MKATYTLPIGGEPCGTAPGDRRWEEVSEEELLEAAKDGMSSRVSFVGRVKRLFNLDVAHSQCARVAAIRRLHHESLPAVVRGECRPFTPWHEHAQVRAGRLFARGFSVEGVVDVCVGVLSDLSLPRLPLQAIACW